MFENKRKTTVVEALSRKSFFQQAPVQQSTTQKNTCSGWESDPESMSVSVMSVFTKNHPDLGSTVSTLNCSLSTLDNVTTVCLFRLENGRTGGVNINPSKKSVSVLIDKLKGIGIEHICSYTYSCDVGSKIQFTLLECTNNLKNKK
ncbi:MAG: hypothetical protein ACKVPJ_13680 [Chitinophagales bacterium]